MTDDTRVVWKYELALGQGPQTIDIPTVATFLHAHEQMGRPCLWFDVKTTSPTVARTFRVQTTGEPVPPSANRYLGTVHVSWTVWHVYEEVAT